MFWGVRYQESRFNDELEHEQNRRCETRKKQAVGHARNYYTGNNIQCAQLLRAHAFCYVITLFKYDQLQTIQQIGTSREPIPQGLVTAATT